MLEKILTGPKIHYSELGPARPGSSNAVEWETYRREVGRLIAEGHEGKYVLLDGEEVVGIFDTWEDAKREGLTRYCKQGRQSVIRHILTYEPTLKLNPRLAA